MQESAYHSKEVYIPTHSVFRSRTIFFSMFISSNKTRVVFSTSWFAMDAVNTILEIFDKIIQMPLSSPSILLRRLCVASSLLQPNYGRYIYTFCMAEQFIPLRLSRFPHKQVISVFLIIAIDILFSLLHA